MTPNATIVTAILKRIGATLGSSTTKMARYTLPNGTPLAVETDRKTPNIWMCPEHSDLVRALGRAEHYEARRGRHHHLKQVPEFAGRDLVKVSISDMRWPQIEAALGGLTGGR